MLTLKLLDHYWHFITVITTMVHFSYSSKRTPNCHNGLISDLAVSMVIQNVNKIQLLLPFSTLDHNLIFLHKIALWLFITFWVILLTDKQNNKHKRQTVTKTKSPCWRKCSNLFSTLIKCNHISSSMILNEWTDVLFYLTSQMWIHYAKTYIPRFCPPVGILAGLSTFPVVLYPGGWLDIVKGFMFPN